jgi:hypothetical protein
LVTVDRSQAYGSRIVRGGGGAMRKDKGCEEQRTRRGRRALMAKPHGGESKAEKKAQGAKMAER